MLDWVNPVLEFYVIYIVYKFEEYCSRSSSNNNYELKL